MKRVLLFAKHLTTLHSVQIIKQIIHKFVILSVYLILLKFAFRIETDSLQTSYRTLRQLVMELLKAFFCLLKELFVHTTCTHSTH
jgi:hypothetical protein